MWSEVVASALLLVAIQTAGTVGEGRPSENNCSRLNYNYYQNKEWMESLLLSQVWNDPSAVRWIRDNDDNLTVEVWGAWGASRAAAALVNAGLRYALRYHTVLNTTMREFYNLSSLPKALVAPAAPWNGSLVGDNLENLIGLTAGPAASLSLQLFGYLVGEVRDKCAEPASAWYFYANVTALQQCLFLYSENLSEPHLWLKNLHFGSCRNCAVLLARNETRNDIKVVQEFEKRSKLKFKISYYDDLDLRQTINNKMKDGNISFLFLYEDIWDGVEGIVHVQPPPPLANYNMTAQYSYDLDPTSSIRFGDGRFTKTYAPTIYQVMKHFQPTTKTLRQVLNYEQKNQSIEEAACSWALENKEEFKSWFDYRRWEEGGVGRGNLSDYFIIILFCDSSEKTNYWNLLLKVKAEILDLKPALGIKMGIYYIDCKSEYSDNSMNRILTEQTKPYVVGVVVWGWIKGAAELVNLGRQTNLLPIIFAGPVTTDIQLRPGAQSASGSLTDLIRAYHQFFNLSHWNRIAILSDETKYAKSFIRSLTIKKKFIYRELIILDDQSITTHLKSLDESDARIFLINTNSTTANKILCVALQRSMTTKDKYVWIVRDGIHDIQCHLTNNTIEDMEYFTVGLDWRGGSYPFINSSRLESLRRVVSEMRRHNNTSPEKDWDDIVIPPGGSHLVDALSQLVHGFIKFSKSYPTLLYDFHGADNQQLFRQILGKMSVDGVTQTLEYNEQYYIKEPLVFVDLWRGKKRCSLAVWQVMSDRIITKWSLKNFFDHNQKIKDRRFCWIVFPSNSFELRCQDWPLTIICIILILLCLALAIARRIRLAHIKNHDLQPLKYHIRIATALDTYLVERHCVKILHEIGNGQFGKVYFAELKRHGNGNRKVIVAAKVPKQCTLGEGLETFLQEASLLARLRHDNVIKLMGVCHNDGPPMVLMEFALNADLKRYLVMRRQHAYEKTTSTITDDISDKTLTRLARQAAAALDYLSEQRIVHRDVRAANCLVDKDLSLKLADFGMARLLTEDVEYTTHRRALFPILWMAPESLEEGIFSPASDVWSLGVLLLEIVMLGTRPFGKWQPERVYTHVTKGGHAPLPPDISIHTRKLTMACWRREPEQRPSAAEVRDYLALHEDALTLTLLSPFPHVTELEYTSSSTEYNRPLLNSLSH